MKVKKFLSVILSVFLLLGLLGGCGNENAAPEEPAGAFSIGYGQTDISPTGSLPLMGFGDEEERYSTRITERLYATCIAIKDREGDTVVIVAYDLIKPAENWSTPLREELSKETGLPVSNIMLHCSHTHSAPDIEHLPGYQMQVAQKTVEAVKLAIADISPATVYGAYTRIEEKVNCVRHYLLSDGSYMGEKVGTISKDRLIGHTSQPDNLLQMVKFQREGKKDIVMMNWQGHPLGEKMDHYAVTSDYVGIARTTVEKAMDCYSIFIFGGSGNLNHSSQLPGEMKFDYHTEVGQFLGDKVVELNNSLTPLCSDNLQIKEVIHPTPTKSNPDKKQDVPLYAVSFGDIGMIFAPYEMFDTSAMFIRDHSPFTMTFCASVSNAGRTYIPTPQSWDWEEKYEVRVTLYQKGTAEVLANEFVRMLTELSGSGYTPVPKGENYLTPTFEPATDGATYINTTPGDLSACTEVKNGFYQIGLLKNGTRKIMLAKDKATAEAVLRKDTMQLLFDASNVIVGVVE